MPNEVEVRVHGRDSLPTLVCLPGMHGDWTLVGSFRAAVAGRLRFVEVVYPRTPDASLDDCTRAIQSALRRHGIVGGWLLGESFGSQIAWQMIAHSARGRESLDSAENERGQAASIAKGLPLRGGL